MEIWKKHQNYTNSGTSPHTDTRSMGYWVLFRSLLEKEKGHLTEMDEEGYIKEPDDEGKSLFVKMESYGGRLIAKNIGETLEEHIFLFNDGVYSIQLSGTNYVHVSGVSHNEEQVREIRKFYVDQFLPRVQQGHIFAIVRHGPHLGLNTIGDASIPLERGNYTPAVMEVYDAAVKDLKSATPAGRIAILEGEPGTGKTHLIRALLHEVEDAMFVLISPDMVSSLQGPDLLPVLLTNKQSYQLSGPIVLVLEDADRCLVRREGDNISEIQSLLNLGDGILGSLLDLRIIATTNAKKLEMEPALMRPGRLSQRLEVGPLDPATAQKVFSRLCPTAKFPVEINGSTNPGKFKVTLAEVYSMARKAGWEPAPREEKPGVAGGLTNADRDW